MEILSGRRDGRLAVLGNSSGQGGDQAVEGDFKLGSTRFACQIDLEELVVDTLEIWEWEIACLRADLVGYKVGNAQDSARVGTAVEGFACLKQQPDLADDHTEGIARRMIFEKAVKVFERYAPVALTNGIHHGEYVALSMEGGELLDIMNLDGTIPVDVVKQLLQLPVCEARIVGDQFREQVGGLRINRTPHRFAALREPANELRSTWCHKAADVGEIGILSRPSQK